MLPLQCDPVEEPDPGVGQQRLDLVAEHVGLAEDELVGPLADRTQLLVGVEAAGGSRPEAGGGPVGQARHPDHEELVEVAGEDGEELHPLQQRQLAVRGQGQHPTVEVEPGQLPVQVSTPPFFGGSRRHCRGDTPLPPGLAQAHLPTAATSMRSAAISAAPIDPPRSPSAAGTMRRSGLRGKTSARHACST